MGLASQSKCSIVMQVFHWKGEYEWTLVAIYCQPLGYLMVSKFIELEGMEGSNGVEHVKLS